MYYGHSTCGATQGPGAGAARVGAIPCSNSGFGFCFGAVVKTLIRMLIRGCVQPTQPAQQMQRDPANAHTLCKCVQTLQIRVGPANAHTLQICIHPGLVKKTVFIVSLLFFILCFLLVFHSPNRFCYCFCFPLGRPLTVKKRLGFIVFSPSGWLLLGFIDFHKFVIHYHMFFIEFHRFSICYHCFLLIFVRCSYALYRFLYEFLKLSVKIRQFSIDFLWFSLDIFVFVKSSHRQIGLRSAVTKCKSTREKKT